MKTTTAKSSRENKRKILEREVPRKREKQYVRQLYGAAGSRPAPGRPKGTGGWRRIGAGIENLSGIPMNDVTVHYNSPEPDRLQASAYTQGTNIYVGPGQEKHLAHEAWHVVQQKQGRVKPTVRMKGRQVNNDAGLEREAETMGRRAYGAVHGPPAGVSPAGVPAMPAQGSGGVVQRMPKHDDNWQKRLAKFKAEISAVTLTSVEQATENRMYIAAQNAAKDLDSTDVPVPGIGSEIKAAPKPIEDYITEVKSKTGKSAELESNIRWDPTWKGLGTKMQAILRPGTIPVGSKPTIKDEGAWGTLADRGGKDAKTKMYIMGHMLNDNIGGPGLAYNLTPLVGSNKTGGADNSNKLHLNMVEDDVKDACDEMQGSSSKIKEVRYSVEAVYGRTKRTAKITKLKDVLRDYTAISTSDPSMTHNDAKKNLIGSGTLDKSDIMNACKAIFTGPSTKAKQVRPKMEANVELWKAEDEYVPNYLHCEWSTFDGSTFIKDVKKDVVVSLPDDISVPYKGA